MLRVGSAIVLSTIVLSTFGCGGDPAEADTTSTSGAGGSSSAATSGGSTGTGAPAGDVLTLEVESFDVQPGTERQVCKTINLPEGGPFDIVRLVSKMAGTSHHFNAYKVIAANALEPVSEAESTVHDCSPAKEQLQGDAAYFFGAATPERTLETPEGVAFHFQPGQRIILEQHVINAGSEVVQGGVSFDLVRAEDPAAVKHHADVMWFANWKFMLQAAGETSVTAHCKVPYDVEVFGLMSHTHALGSHFSIETWSESATEHVYDSIDWAHPPYVEYAPTIPLAAGEGFEWTCTWKNPGAKPVFPGKNSTDEMCMMFAAAYPKDGLSGDPIQCNLTGF